MHANSKPTLENSKAIATRFLDLVGKHDIDALAELVTPDWTMAGGPPNLATGPAGVRALFATFGRIQQHWRVDEVIGERTDGGDVVVVRGTCTVEQDQFFGVPAAGIQQVFAATFVHHFRDGRIAETHRTANDLGRLLQLGAVIRLPNDWISSGVRSDLAAAAPRPERAGSC